MTAQEIVSQAVEPLRSSFAEKKLQFSMAIPPDFRRFPPIPPASGWP